MKKYDNFIKIDKFKCLSDGVKWKLDIVEKTISEIDKYVDSIPFRKSKNYVNNLLINSKLGKMYKLYYDLKGEKINKLPINKAIYDYESLFLTIENKKNDVNSMFMELLKDYIIFELYQRSADLFLGVPFNIASYALLTMMLAQVTGYEIGDFIHTLGDAHIYLNHLEQVDIQLTREPRKLPQMKINPDVKDIFEFKYEDFELIDYNPHPHIKAEVSI